MTARVFIAVGSNLGERLNLLKRAAKLAGQTGALKIFRVSPVYETEPAGGPPQGKYLNAVWEAETDLNPEGLLQKLLEVEAGLGRKRGERNAPRTIDLDILFYGDQVVHQPGLVIPHPRLHERDFVLKPLADLAADLMHPKLKKTVKELLEEIRAGNPKP